MAFNSRNPYQNYKRTEIESLSPGELIIMLYDGLVRFLQEAIDNSHDFRKYDLVNNRLLKAQDIISELMVSLNMDGGGDISKNLMSIYIYLKKVLIEANVKKDRSKMEEAMKHIRELREAWQQVVDKEEGRSVADKKINPPSSGGISFTG